MKMLFWLGLASVAAGVGLLWLYRKNFATCMEDKLYACLSGGGLIFYGAVLILGSYHPNWFT